MQTINLNFAEIPSNEIVPEGVYPVIVDEVKAKDSKSGPYPYLNIKLKVTEGEHAGRVLFMMRSLSPKALWKFRSTLEALGVYQEQLNVQIDEATGTVFSPDMVGKTCAATVIHETWNEQTRAKVDEVAKLAGAATSTNGSSYL